MAKPLPTSTTFEQLIDQAGDDLPAELLPAELTEEMYTFWQEAQNELLSPSPEAINRLFENISALYMDEALQ
jgi:hypothetical protein